MISGFESARANFFTWVFIVTVSVCLPFAAHAADKPKKGASAAKPKEGAAAANLQSGITGKAIKKDSPIRISSDRMEAMQQEKTLLFEGHVVVQQDDLTLTGNRLKLFGLSGDKPGDKSDQSSIVDKIDHIELEGDVKMTQLDKMATAQKAIYYHQEQKIVLYGNPVVSRGQDKIEGRLITIYLEQGKSVVEGGEETPVQAVLFPSRKQ